MAWTEWSHAGEEYTATAVDVDDNQHFQLRFGRLLWRLVGTDRGFMGQLEPFGRYMCKFVGEGHECLP